MQSQNMHERVQKIDTRQLRTCLGHFATGVTIVTYKKDNDLHGITVNSFTSVSLEPPLILVSIDRRAKACELLKNTPFIINILKKDQWNLAMHFAGRPDENLAISWEQGGLGPRLPGSLAYIECRPWTAYDGGDHVLYLGHVEHFEMNDGEPLLFYQGQFKEIR